MTTELRDLLPAVAALADPATPGLDLADVSALVSLSPSRAQRVFTELIGESPKQFELRLRLDRAAVLLASSDARIVDVAFACGFGSHEGLTRAFRRRFGVSPRDWRRALRAGLGQEAAQLTTGVGPCIGLYRRRLEPKEQPMTYEIATRDLDVTPVLYQARRVDRDEIATVLAEVLPAVFGYVVEQGLEMAGPPYVRYLELTPAFASIEGGIPLVSTPPAPPDSTGILAGELPGGAAAVTRHRGPYDSLGDAHAALDRWMAANDAKPAGPAWEVYLTDPGETPDPEDWITEVVWPIVG